MGAAVGDCGPGCGPGCGAGLGKRKMDDEPQNAGEEVTEHTEWNIYSHFTNPCNQRGKLSWQGAHTNGRDWRDSCGKGKLGVFTPFHMYVLCGKARSKTRGQRGQGSCLR